MTAENERAAAAPGISAGAIAARVTQIAERYPDPTGRVIGMLNDVQDEYRYVPDEALRAIAEECDVPYDQLVSATEFFGTLSTEPVGEHIIEVCDGTACHTLGATRLADAIADALGIEVGQTTPDGRFTLKLVHCVGACSVAPVVVKDGTAYGRVKVSDAASIVREDADVVAADAASSDLAGGDRS